jgi:hypothetical protein
LVRLTVDNSHFDSNGADGIRVNSGDGMISRSGAAGNGRLGIIGSSSLNAVSLTVVSTTATKNGLGSFYVATTDTMTMESSLAHGNGLYGLGAFAGGIARISNSVFTENGDGIRNVGGTVETRQNNTVRGNGTDINGMLTAIGGI